MRSDFKIVISVVVAVLTGACNGCFGCQSPVDRPGGNINKACEAEPPALAPQKLDVLFVVDNSGSMRDEQLKVASELTAFVDALRVAGGVAQDIRVGVITTTVYLHALFDGSTVPPYFYSCANLPAYCTQSGKLQPVPDAASDGGILPNTGTQRVLDDEDPEFVAKFARLVQVGIQGSGQETPFEALRLALSPPLSETPVEQGGNAGFLRDGARLLIVIVTDEDDCSEKLTPPQRSVVQVGQLPDRDYCTEGMNNLTPVSEYRRFLVEDVKDSDGTPKEIVYTVIGPVSTVNKAAMTAFTTEPWPDGGSYQQVRNIDCPTSFEPGFRHRQMAESFYSDLTNLDSICKTDYRQTLLEIANLAGVSQVLDVGPVPDPAMLLINITRKDGRVDECTIDNGGIERYEAPTADDPTGRLTFGANCKRRRDDTQLVLKLLCIY
jgi:hypothetical protein